MVELPDSGVRDPYEYVLKHRNVNHDTDNSILQNLQDQQGVHNLKCNKAMKKMRELYIVFSYDILKKFFLCSYHVYTFCGVGS